MAAVNKYIHSFKCEHTTVFIDTIHPV